MKVLLKATALFVFLVSWELPAQHPPKTVHVLLIGNSFSQNATRYLPQIAEEANIKLVLGRAEMGGCSLGRHWDSVAVNNQDSTRGLAYNKKSLRQLLSSQKWDIVTLQQFSQLSADRATYQPYASRLDSLIKQYQPRAKIMIHQTWAYRADAKSFGKTDGEKRAKNQEEMWQKSRMAYHQLAKELGASQIIPSGDAFHSVATHRERAFKRDVDFDETKAVYPMLPHEVNSLNVGYTWDKDHKLKFDPNHANEAGCYLAALVWYKVMLGQDPNTVKFKPESITDEFAAFLKQTAFNTGENSRKTK